MNLLLLLLALGWVFSLLDDARKQGREDERNK